MTMEHRLEVRKRIMLPSRRRASKAKRTSSAERPGGRLTLGNKTYSKARMAGTEEQITWSL